MNWNKAIASWTSACNKCTMEAGPSGHTPGQCRTSEPMEVDEAMEVDEPKEDLVGEPYAVVESDPGSSVLSHCEHHSHACLRRLHVYHATAWGIGRRGEGGREH
jgi:hypothetical protein